MSTPIRLGNASVEPDSAALVERLAEQYDDLPPEVIVKQVAKAHAAFELFGDDGTVRQAIVEITDNNLSRVSKALHDGARLTQEQLTGMAA